MVSSKQLRTLHTELGKDAERLAVIPYDSVQFIDYADESLVEAGSTKIFLGTFSTDGQPLQSAEPLKVYAYVLFRGLGDRIQLRLFAGEIFVKDISRDEAFNVLDLEPIFKPLHSRESTSAMLKYCFMKYGEERIKITRKFKEHLIYACKDYEKTRKPVRSRKRRIVEDISSDDGGALNDEHDQSEYRRTRFRARHASPLSIDPHIEQSTPLSQRNVAPAVNDIENPLSPIGAFTGRSASPPLEARGRATRNETPPQTVSPLETDPEGETYDSTVFVDQDVYLVIPSDTSSQMQFKHGKSLPGDASNNVSHLIAKLG